MEDNRDMLYYFSEYLKEKDSIIQKELEPFYRREYEREQSGMNSYGVATPGDRYLLNESAFIQNLRTIVNSYDSFEEFVTKIKKEIDTSKETNVILNLKRQLQYIDEYLENHKNSSVIPESAIINPPCSNKRTL